jgi:hypothetical protein
MTSQQARELKPGDRVCWVIGAQVDYGTVTEVGPEAVLIKWDRWPFSDGKGGTFKFDHPYFAEIGRAAQ